MTKWELILALLLIAGAPAMGAAPQEFEASVISIHDGDTMRVRRNNDGRYFKLRLFAIDAPEITQPSGVDSRDSLRSLVGSSDVKVRTTGAVTYGRHVARVYVGGNYLNEIQVADGWAWHYDSFTSGQAEHTEFRDLQSEAKSNGEGLWAYPNPVAPWDYRRLVQDGQIQFAPAQIAFAPAADGLGLRLAPVMIRPSAAPRDLGAAHYIYGKPKAFDDRHRFTPDGQAADVAGITELTRTAFALGHYDKYRQPAWVAMKWTKARHKESERVSFGRPRWREDDDLPPYARGDGKLDYDNTSLQKGHMARDADVEAWGAIAVREAATLSNAVPQSEHANHTVWGVLEDLHRDIVANESDAYDIPTVWIISGPVFYQGQNVETVGKTAIPHATYKVLGWHDPQQQFHTRAYIIGQGDSDSTLSRYLRSIDEVEAATGFDFFPELEDASEAAIESVTPLTLWE